MDSERESGSPPPEPRRTGEGERAGEPERTGFVEDLKRAPEEMRAAVGEADERLAEEVRSKPTLAGFVDPRMAILAALAALIIALVLRLIGLSTLLSVVLFLVLFGVLWYALARATRRPPPLEAQRADAGDQDADAATAGRPSSEGPPSASGS